MWRLAEDTLSEDDLDALADWLRGYPRLTQGEQVAAFEAAWSQWLGVDDSVLVSSGTTANFALIAVVSKRLGRRPRTGVASVTWATNVTPSLMLGHDVTVFDINPRTLGVDADQVCTAMDRGEIDILFVTHLLGFNALSAEMIETAHRNGVILLEDCCEAHGARTGERRVGTTGLGSTFSFYFGHHMSTIEGGMVSTNDAELADELRLMRAHGLARESARYDEYAAQHPGVDPRFLFVQPGLNFRSTELNAFLGLRQLKVLDERIEHRNRNLAAFLAGAPGYLRRDFCTDGVSSFALPLIADSPDSARRVQRVVDALAIESRPVVAGNLVRQPFMTGYDVRIAGGAVPVAEHVHECGLYVGNGHHVNDAMVHELTEALEAAGGD